MFHLLLSVCVWPRHCRTSDSTEIILSLVFLVLTVTQRKCNRLVSLASVSQRLAIDQTGEGTKTVSQCLAIDQTGEGTKTVSQRLAIDQTGEGTKTVRLAREQSCQSVFGVDQTSEGTKMVSH